MLRQCYQSSNFCYFLFKKFVYYPIAIGCRKILKMVSRWKDASLTNQLEVEINYLKLQLRCKQEEMARLLIQERQNPDYYTHKLNKDEITRYSRQIILPEVGVEGQMKLKCGKVLIVGIGGLGCPAGQYLNGAGVGTIGLLDYDEVELHNLHRQLLHAEQSIGDSKTQSALSALTKLNGNTIIYTHHVQLTSENAMEIIGGYDIVLDATDNVATRYLLNDACVMLKKPLVSGSALQFEGQLTVYNYADGPCYRCIYPTPPPPEAVTNCGDGGVVGAITGVIGSLQALETIKILLGQGDVLAGRLLIFDGMSTTFRTVRLRYKRPNCDVCSDKPIITRLIDYEEFCGMRATDKDYKLAILDDSERITVKDYLGVIERNVPHTLIDVRSSNEFEICNLPSAINVPIKTIMECKRDEDVLDKISTTNPVYVICRRGNDSQLAVKRLQQMLKGPQKPKDIIGGLHEWARRIDSAFPIY